VPHANWLATAHHGIDVEEYTFGPNVGDYLVFLGRISPEKGLDTAIEVARRSGMPLKVAAREPLSHGTDPSVRRDWEYYDQQIRPLLKTGDVEMLGPVGHAAKNRLLAGAAALLFPIRWPEPFGLVMIEALACGTPVLAFNNGSVPEVLEHAVTGFICDSSDDMVSSVSRIRAIDRMRCRAEAEQRFSAAAMANRYERIYDSLLAGAGATLPSMRRVV
jgi:glycosyltransferase involved in cell wall biosynthesis